jgi:hypothetical protein
MFASHVCHVRSRKGGVPNLPTQLGWTEEVGIEEDFPSYKSHGKQLGWMDWKMKDGKIISGELLLDANFAFEMIKRHAHGAITISKMTMLRRLREAGMLTQVDENRNRNCVRATCQGAVRTVIAMNAKDIVEGLQ